MSEKISMQYNAETQEASEYADLIEDLFGCVNTHLLERFNTMLDKAEEELFESGQQAENNEKQTLYMDTMQIVRAERGNLDKQFFVALNDSLKPAESSEEGELAELSLVGHDEMEELVAITTMHSKAMNLYGGQVDNLEARLEYLEIKAAGMFDKQALIPQRICKVFQSAMQPLNIETDKKLILYTLFDRHVSATLEEMYDELNTLLVKQGILPNIVLKTVKHDCPDDAVAYGNDRATESVNEQNNKNEHHQSGPDDGQGRASSSLGGGFAGSIDRIVNQLLSGDTAFSGEDLPESFKRVASRTEDDGEAYYSREDVTRALSRLQSQLIVDEKAEKPLEAELIKRAVVADIGSMNGGVVTQRVHTLDERTIDFVGLMFDAITSDENISQVITNLMLRLQIPVIKVALLDHELFDQDDHPARTTLDRVSVAGKSVNEREDRLYGDIEAIVDALVKEYDIDIDSFERAAEALQVLIDNEQQIADDKEKEEQRQIMCAHAREVVVTELRKLTANKRIPKNVQPLILRHWSTLMLNRYIRDGRDSDQWMQSLLLLKSLMRCLQPPENRDDWEHLNEHHGQLVESFQAELKKTRQDQSAITDVMDTLKSRFRAMLDKYDFTLSLQADSAASSDLDSLKNLADGELARSANDDVGDDAADDIVQRVDEEELAAMQAAAAEARAKIIKLPSSARPGVWFEVYNGDDSPIRRLKLSMVLTEVAKLVFVNSRGVKVIEKDAGEFAEELEVARSRMIADHSAFEAALGSVIHRLAA